MAEVLDTVFSADDTVDPSVLPSASAQEAREAAATRLARPYRAGIPVAPEESEPEADYSVLPSQRREAQSGDVDLAERFRLNAVYQHYRGTPEGAGQLASMAHLVSTPEERLDEGERRVRKTMAKQYDGVVADLARYDLLQPWGTTFEGAAALGGQLAGGGASVASVAGVPARGATALLRTIRAAAQQGGIQAAIDPALQYLGIQAGVQKEYDPVRTVEAAGMGAIIGGGLHAGGELFSAMQVRKLRADLATEDSAFAGDVERQAAAEPEIPQQLPSDQREAVAAKPEEPAPASVTEEQPAPPLDHGAHAQWRDQKQLISDIRQQVKDGLFTEEEGQAKIADITGAKPPMEAAPATPQEVLGPAEATAQLEAKAKSLADAMGTQLDEIKNVADIATAKKYNKDFEAAAQGFTDDEVFALVKHAQATKAAAAATAPKATGPEEIESAWQKVGGQKGSNPGGTYKDPDGTDWYVKVPKTEDHARNELLANELYFLAGVDVPVMKTVTLGGKPAVASRILTGDFKKLGQLDKFAKAAAIEELRKDFAADAWLANHDVVGLTEDNVMVDPQTGSVARIDQGGALKYRAQGEPKKGFGNTAGEWWSMRDPAAAPQAAAVFKDMTDRQLLDSLNKVLLIPKNKIQDAVGLHGPEDPTEIGKLADTLIKRQDYLRAMRDDLQNKINAPTPAQPSAPAPAPPPTPAQPPKASPAEQPLTFQKGEPIPPALNGIDFKKAIAAKDWSKVGGQKPNLFEPMFSPPAGKKPGSGVIMVEPDGRVWLAKPSNAYGGYEHTFPKGGVEHGLSLQANAIKEVFEETGLKAKITGFLGDYERDTSYVRFYRGERIGGSPTLHGPESEAVVLAPVSKLGEYLNKQHDFKVAADAFGTNVVPMPTTAKSTAPSFTAKPTAVPDVIDPAKAQAAKAIGFNLPGDPDPWSKLWYHGTKSQFDRFDLSFTGTNWGAKKEKAVFLSDSKSAAQSLGKGGKVLLPLLTRVKKVMVVPGPQHYSGSKFAAKIAEGHAGGYDAVLFEKTSDVGGTADQLAVLKPNLIRSIHAEFDPAKVTSAKLAAVKGEKPELQAMMGEKEGAPEDFDAAYQDMLRQAIDDQVSAAGEGVAAEKPAEAQPALPGAVPAGAPPTLPPELQAIAQRKSGATLAQETKRPSTGVAQPVGTSVTTPAGAPGVPANVPAAASAQATQVHDAAIRSLQQQVLDLAKALDLPVREGRVQIKGALGTYNSASGVSRVKEVPDLAVVSHEAGHAIEAKVGADITNLTQQFAHELGPLDYEWPTQARPAEGFAEYIRHMIGNPAYAQTAAPGFTTAFRNFMQQRAPEMLKALDNAAQGYQAYLQAPSRAVTGSTVRFGDDEGNALQRVTTRLREDGFPTVIKSVLQNIYTAVLDDKAPVARAVRDLAQAIRDQDPNHALVNLKAADNPEVLIRLVARSQQGATRDMMDGVRPYHSITPEGPALADAITKAVGAPTVWGKWDREAVKEFSRYLVDRRAEVLWRKFEAGDLPNPPVSFSKADALTAMTEREAANPNFREASDMVHAYTRQLLRKQYEGGLIDKDLYDRLLREEFYVPMMRDMSDKPLAGEGGGGSSEGPGMTQTVKRMKGSSRDEIDPLESIMMQTFLVNRTLRHNDVIRSFVDLARQAGIEGGKYVEKLPAHEARKYTFDLGDALQKKAIEKGVPPDDAKLMAAAIANQFGEDPLMGSYFKMEPAQKRGEPLVFYKEGGQLKVARFMSEKEGHALYETLTAAPEPITDVWHDLIRGAATIKRTGIITNPTFALSNYIRDQFAVSILRSDYVPILGGLKGIVAEVTQGESAKLYGYAGGVAGGASTGPVERAVEAEIDALAKQGYLVNRVTSFKGLLELASITEAGTRNSVFENVFKAKKGQGLSDYEAMIEAAYQAQDILDFSRHGSRTLAIRNILPFINAHMQGLDKAWRTIVEPMVTKLRGGQALDRDSAEFKNAVLTAIKVGGLGAALGAAWSAINQDNEAYRDASPYFKGTHLIVPFGNKLIVVPKPFELGLGFTAGEYAFQAMTRDDPRMAQQFLSATWQAIGPPSVLTDIPLVSTAAELYLGKSLFTGNDIVPGGLQRLPAAEQYTDRTSSLAKWLGQMTGVSPMKIDYGIGSQFGTWGRDIMALSQGVDENAPTANWEDRVFSRRFIKDPTRTSDVTTKFWNFMGQTTGTYNQNVAAYDNFVKLHDDAGAAQFLNNLSPRERAFVTMKSAADENGKAAFKADEKRLHPLQRAYDAVTILNGLRRDLVNNNVSKWENNEPLKLDPNARRDLLDNVRELAQMEMRNSFVIMKEPGYANRALLDTNSTMEKIHAIAPGVADEIATRYATNKIYTTQAVAAAYPQMERALLRDGSEADLGGLAADAKAEGYEFGGDRVKRPAKRRVVIPGQPAAAPPL